MKVLFIGDIVGKVGRITTKALLPVVVNRYKVDFVIANGENAAGGFGITDSIVSEILNCGVHIITTGNHVWDKKEFITQISKEDIPPEKIHMTYWFPDLSQGTCRFHLYIQAIQTGLGYPAEDRGRDSLRR